MSDVTIPGGKTRAFVERIENLDIELQELIAELQELLYEAPLGQSATRIEIASRLRALLRRMLARELEINSPKVTR